MKKSTFPDPFEQARLSKGISEINDQDDPVKMLLRFKDVKEAAENWKTFQSGAIPGRIVVPSEVNIRDIRQIPFEVDPPDHEEYRDLVEDWFKRPFQKDYDQKLSIQIEAIVDEMLKKDSFEVVQHFSLPLQSRALTLLLNVPEAEAKKFITWGIHVFRSDDTDLDASKANVLYDYLDEQIEKAIEQPNDSMYSVLLNSEFQGRKLTKEEIKGVMILTFAGGRDTVINMVTNTIAYLADHPKSLERLGKEKRLVHQATEEFIRYFSPLTHMGRVVTEDTQVCEHAIKNDSRVSLCWASANRDAAVFENPNEVILGRKNNPHLGFGHGVHKCLGAHHARKVLKILIKNLANKVQSIDIVEKEDKIEDWEKFQRKVGFDKLVVKFNAKNNLTM